ncbi:MAG: DUF928 domain-containing protein [Pseudomonadota bacterium]
MTYQSLIKYGLQWIVAISLGAVIATSNAAEQGQSVMGSQAVKTADMRPAIIYKPPLRDDSPDEADESKRGMDGEAAILQVLAPDHTGLTLQAQPTLYWYARTPVVTRFKIALLDKDKIDPLLEVKAGSEKAAGIQQLNLGDHNLSLQPELRYQWSVTQVIDEGSQSTGVIASGVIELMEPGEGLTSRIEKSHGMDLVSVYAIEGIWYDALKTISSMIDESPEDQSLVAIRESLLDQVGLHAAAGN